jgi:quercetin dioxygenase-like cupin family protein/ligand-binding sensor protein
MSEHTSRTRFDWGRIEWLHEPEAGSSDIISIGIQTIERGKEQSEHVHTAEEQVLCVLSGKGTQRINDDEMTKAPGDIFHIASGSVHQTTNTGKEPLRELIVSIPANYGRRFLPGANTILPRDSMDAFLSKINAGSELEELFKSFTSLLALPVAYFDRANRMMIRSENLPPRCQLCRSLKNGKISCSLYDVRDSIEAPNHIKPTAFICPHGLSVIVCSIVFNGEMIGMLKGGHIVIFPEDIPGIAGGADASPCIDDGENARLFYSKAHVNAIMKQFERLSCTLTDFFAIKLRDYQIDTRETALRNIREQDRMLKETLRSSAECVLSIRMNNHFLFNALNAIANLAVSENDFRTYDALLSLTNMFRYSLRKGMRNVPLSDEISYLTSYLKLQELRFGKKFRVEMSIDRETLTKQVPFNCLQPIVENSFRHGFSDADACMEIRISASTTDSGSLRIAIDDNGAGMSKEELDALKSHVQNAGDSPEVSGGVAMVHSKFRHHYGSDFVFILDSKPLGGMHVLIELPGSAGNGAHHDNHSR